MIDKIVFLVIIILSTLSGNVLAQEIIPQEYHIIWNKQSNHSGESMPLCGRDLGCNVWVENGEILIYLQKSGSLSENGEYLKLGRIRIQLEPNLLSNDHLFRQELLLEDGYIQIESTHQSTQEQLVTINLWVDINTSAVHIDINSRESIRMNAIYESWRTEDKELKPIAFGRERFGCFSLEGYRDKVIRSKDVINPSDQKIVFYHRNPDHKLIPDILLKQQELESYRDEIYDDIKYRTFGGCLHAKDFSYLGSKEGVYQNTKYKSWILQSNRARKTHHIIISSHIAQSEHVFDWKHELSDLVKRDRKHQHSSLKQTKGWWHQFWKRSHIFIHPNHHDSRDPVWQMSRNYQLFRYQLGGNAFGEYPTKFNGGNLIFDPVLVMESADYGPDWRQWGGAIHTAQNQRLLYWPMLKSGDFDAILPQFELYRKALPGARARVKKHFGHDGAVFSEYISAPGIVFGSGWGWEGKGHRARGTEVPFGSPEATGARGYNDIVEEGVMANQSCAYHWESQLEHAYMILEYHRYSGNDISAYLPFIEEALIFFDKHYQIRQTIRTGKPLDENGKLLIYPSTSCESYRGATNPTDILAGLKACLKSVLSLSDEYISPKKKEYYREYLNRIPDYSFGICGELSIIKPARSWLKEANQELPQFYPLFPFNQFQIGNREIQIFKNSYICAPDFRKGVVKSWHQDGIFFARMGMSGEAAAYNTEKLKDSERRFPTFWGPGHDWVPDHNWGGSGMIGLQEMLMQTIGDKILLFPAWPKKWDVDFKLHAPKNTVVECRLISGKVVKLEVSPESRRKDIENHLLRTNSN